MDENEKAIDKIRKARISLLSKSPFFGHLTMHLKLKRFTEEEEKSFGQYNLNPTAGVDKHGNLYYSPDFINSLCDRDMEFLICHEVLHCALNHTTRGGNRVKESWQGWGIAIDCIVNNILIQNDFHCSERLSNGAIIPKNNKLIYDKIVIENIDKKTAEEIYDELMKQAEQNNMIKEVEDYQPMDDHSKHSKGNEGVEEKSENRELEKEWKKNLITASEQVKKQGTLPAGLDRYIDELLNNKINWKTLLQRHIVNEVISDFSWKKRSNKSIATGYYLPKTKKENIEVTLFVDVSGSISQRELNEFITEIYNIGKYFETLKIHVIFWDTEMTNHYELTKNSLETITNCKINGGGGSIFTEIYNYTKDKIPNTKLIITLTDGYIDFPKEEEIKTIWILTKGGIKEEEIPFGIGLKLE